MKLWLSFNLLPYLQGTGIAQCFGLTADETQKRTLIEVPDADVADLLKLLTALQEELEQRERRLGKRDTRSPLGEARKAEVSQQAAAVAKAVRQLREQS